MKFEEAKQLVIALLDFEFTRSYLNDLVRFVYILGVGFNALLAFLLFLQGLTFGGILGGFFSLIVGAVGFLVGLAVLRLTLETLLVVTAFVRSIDSTAGTLRARVDEKSAN